MDTTFHIGKRLSIYERAEIADARVRFEWNKNTICFKQVKFREKIHGLLELIAAGYKPTESEKELYKLCNSFNITKYLNK